MVWNALKLSLLVVSVATVLIGLIGTAFGYLLARRSFRGKDVLDAILTLPMVLPPTVTGYYLILAMGRRGFLGKPLDPDRFPEQVRRILSGEQVWELH